MRHGITRPRSFGILSAFFVTVLLALLAMPGIAVAQESQSESPDAQSSAVASSSADEAIPNTNADGLESEADMIDTPAPGGEAGASGEAMESEASFADGEASAQCAVVDNEGLECEGSVSADADAGIEGGEDANRGAGEAAGDPEDLGGQADSTDILAVEEIDGPIADEVSPKAVDPAAEEANVVLSVQAPEGAAASIASIAYELHESKNGWLAAAADGATAGSKDRQLEAVKISLDGVSGSVSYRVLVKGQGWSDVAKDGSQAGTTGKSLCIQAVRIALCGNAAKAYDVYYRAYVRNLGWLDWTSNNAVTGTSGFDRPLDMLQVKLVEKGAEAPVSSDTAAPVSYITKPSVSVQVHVQRKGWMGAVGNNKVAGTTGKSLRMEAMKISITSSTVNGGAEYSGHVQRVGWQDYMGNNKVAGTTGKSLRMEALDLDLTNDMAECYDVYYRVHVQRYGWLGWAEAAELAGSSGRSLRVEAVQVYVTLRGGSEPASDGKLSFVNSTNIMGPSDKSAAHLARWYKKAYGESAYPAVELKEGGAGSIEAFAKIVYQEATAEGVRAEVAFAQAMFETGYLQYGGLVDVSQYNYCGLKTLDGKGFQSFENVRQGVRAHVQHLKAYASTKPLNNECVDPRFNLVARGVASDLSGLSKRWSNEKDYGDRVNAYLKRIESFR